MFLFQKSPYLCNKKVKGSVCSTVFLIELPTSAASSARFPQVLGMARIYVDSYNKVSRAMKKEGRPELIRSVGITNVHNQKAVERLHSTLKDRLKPTKGLKNEHTVTTLFEGWVVQYNYVVR